VRTDDIDHVHWLPFVNGADIQIALLEPVFESDLDHRPRQDHTFVFDLDNYWTPKQASEGGISFANECEVRMAFMETLPVEIKKLDSAADLPLPSYQTSGAAGMDVLAAVMEDRHVAPGQIELIPTGLMIAIPPGWEAQMRPRSGLAVRHGVTLPNSPATIDSDYRGEILIPLINLGHSPFVISRGMRIAQIVFAQVTTVSWLEVSELKPTNRGPSGFGHTGL
jgi:dUTP pyrophosphatase